MSTHEKLIKRFKGKRILFLENDYNLHNSVGNFYNWCIENKIKTNALFRIKELPMDYILDQVLWFDVIAFETQWVGEKSYEIKEAISKLTDPKIILECYCYKPTWYRKPKGIKHTLFTLECHNEDINEWQFDKLKF